MTERFKDGDIVQHFKRQLLPETELEDDHIYCYQIMEEATHTETREKVMVYQALYGDKSLYVRPLEMFLEKVDRTPYPNLSQTYRFEKVSHLSKQDMFLAYIQAWLDNDSRYLSDWFSDDICYRECYGPEYHGIK